MMAFTYLGDLSTDRDKVRFHLQDTTVDAGPLPGDKNFSDEELDGLISAEGSWQRAVAAGFEVLAAAWRRYPTFRADGFSLNRSDIARGYEAQVQKWRGEFGGTWSIKAAGIIRIDGYSDDVTSDDVQSGSEYGGDFVYVRPK